MATNFFINNFDSSQEKQLLEDLITESIRFYGHDVYYLPRTLNNYDDVYGADDISSYDAAYPLEMYIKSVDGFTGDGAFMSKFGVEIRNQVIFSMSRRVFNEEVAVNTSQVRPNEGDIIYFPLNEKPFIIRFVNKYEMFYPLGTLPTWEVTCELFEYGGETFNTGITEIDEIQTKFSINQYDWLIHTEDADFITDELGGFIMLEDSTLEDLLPFSDNEEIQTESDTFVDFNATDPFSEGTI